MITKDQLPFYGAMSVEQFADRMGISRSLPYLIIREGQLRALKVFSRTLITVADAEDWLARQPLVRAPKKSC